MKTKLRIETLEVRALAGGFWDPLDRDHLLLPSAPPVQLPREATIWLDDLTVSYAVGGGDPTFDDTHRQAFTSHLHRSPDLLPNGTATAYGFLTGSIEFDYATKGLPPAEIVPLADDKPADLKYTSHAFWFRLTIDGKPEGSDSLAPPTPKANDLGLNAPTDGNGQKYLGDGSYIRLDDDAWIVNSAVAYTNGYKDGRAELKVYIQNRKDMSWNQAVANKIEVPPASAGLRFAEFTVPDHSWCYPTTYSYYCNLKWTETNGAANKTATFTVSVDVPFLV